ncbi:unnamed protein product, partial [Adineta ricciae]
MAARVLSLAICGRRFDRQPCQQPELKIHTGVAS